MFSLVTASIKVNVNKNKEFKSYRNLRKEINVMELTVLFS